MHLLEKFLNLVYNKTMILNGDIDEIVFRNEDNGYTVLVLDFNGEPVTCVGKFPPVHEGMRLEVSGEVVKNKKYGEQFSVSTVKVLPPQSKDGLVRFLSSGLIKGVGPVTALSIVERFGEDSLTVIEFNPSKLAEIKGISMKKAEDIALSYNETKNVQKIIMFLQQFDISINLGLKIHKLYGDKTQEILETNPYKLIEDVQGIGFKSADKIALKMGIEQNSPFRIRAATVHVLKENSDTKGNTYALKEDVKTEVFDLLQLKNEDGFNECVVSLIMDGKLKEFVYDNKECLMLSLYFKAEQLLANNLIMLKKSHETQEENIYKEIEKYEKIYNITLHSNQKEAVQTAVNSGVAVITGGPGTGKTTIVKCVLNCFKNRNKSVLLLAPTGRAAKRLSESTGMEASTIHRALEVNQGENNGSYFGKNEYSPLNYDVVIVDEVSMVDVLLMNGLVRALKKNTQLILVGDKDQLPSVGAGNVLADILESNKIPFIELTEIYRQSADSYIITNAHLINKGKMPVLDNKSKDFFFEHKDNSKDALLSVVNLVTLRLPKFLNIDPLKIQVLAPIKMGECGVQNINKELQAKLNPPKPTKAEIARENIVYRVGDKVMHIANDYELEWKKPIANNLFSSGVGVFNGDIGYITQINKLTQEVVVEFEDGRIVTYSTMDLNELVLSYAITIHKSQGSEFDVAVIPVNLGGGAIFNRNLLYTALTRAKKMVVLVGTKYAIKRMIDNNYTVKRYSMLKEFLIQMQKGVDELYKS